MQSPDALRATAACLRGLADRAPTWRHRNELLKMAADFDRLADVAEAVNRGRVVEPARAYLE